MHLSNYISIRKRDIIIIVSANERPYILGSIKYFDKREVSNCLFVTVTKGTAKFSFVKFKIVCMFS